MRKRHPDNTNLTLHHSGPWNGYDVQLQRGPLFIPYLERIHEIMMREIECQARTMAVRVDLKLPRHGYMRDGDLFGFFTQSLQAQIDADMARRKRDGRRGPACKVGYVCVKETADAFHHHYHLCLFLNGECYRGLGRMPEGGRAGAQGFDPDLPVDPAAGEADSLAKKIVLAWSRALGLSLEQAVGLVHFCEGGVYWVRRGAPESCGQVAGLFNRLSYLAKQDTKQFGQGGRNLRCSR